MPFGLWNDPPRRDDMTIWISITLLFQYAVICWIGWHIDSLNKCVNNLNERLKKLEWRNRNRMRRSALDEIRAIEERGE